MLKKHIEIFAKKCAVSRRIRLKAGIIIDLLEQISIGLSSAKHEELINFIRLKTLYPDSIPHQEQISSSLKKWSNGDLTKMVRFIGIYFHLLNQAESNEVVLIIFLCFSILGSNSKYLFKKYIILSISLFGF